MIYRTQVERGAKVLDRVEPGWASRINQDAIEMEMCDRCILGQIYGGYEKGWNTIFGRMPDAFNGYLRSDLGFNLPLVKQNRDKEPDHVILARFAELADDWREAIRERIA